MRVSIFLVVFGAAARAAIMGSESSSIAESTVYTTEEITITSCAATVTNCPADSTTVSLSKLKLPSSFLENLY